MIERIEFFFRISLYLLLGLSSITIGLAEGNLFPHLLTLPLIAIAYFYLDDHPVLKLDSMMTNIIGLTGLVVAIYEFQLGRINVEMRILAASHLLAYFSWIVLVVQKKNQQYWWLLALSVLNMAVSASLTNSSLLGLALLTYLFLAIWTLTLFTTYRGTASLRRFSEQVSRKLPALNYSQAAIKKNSPKKLSTARTSSIIRGGFHIDPLEHWIGFRFLAIVSFLSMASIVVGMGLFLVTPRVWIGNWKFPSGADETTGDNPFGNPVSGFTSNVKLGDIGEILQSSTPVMRVKFSENVTNRVLSSSEVATRLHDSTIRLRGTSLSKYWRGSWSEEKRTLGHSLPTMNPSFTRHAIRFDYELEPVGRDILFTCLPLNAGLLQGEDVLTPFLQQNTITGGFYTPSPDLSSFNTIKYTTISNPLKSPDHSGFPVISLRDRNVSVWEKGRSRKNREESFQSVLKLISETIETEYQAETAKRQNRRTNLSGYVFRNQSTALRVRAYDKYLRSLLAVDQSQLTKLIETAQSLCESKEEKWTAVERARILQNYLKNSGKFSYTLNLSITDPTIDPVEDFLFNRKTGHCEYFASSLTLMLRSVGIPARLVTGFVEGQWDEEKEQLIIQQRHAHAWTEAFIEGHWVVLDATPSLGIAGQENFAMAKYSWKNLQANLSTFWRTYVLGVSLAGQKETIYDPLGDKMKSAYNFADNVRSFYMDDRAVEAESPEKASQRLVPVLLLILLISGSVLFAILYLLRNRFPHLLKSLFPNHSSRSQQRQMLLFFRQFLELAAKNGLKKRPEQTAREFSKLFQQKFHPQLAAVSLNSLPDSLTTAYYQARFRGTELSEHDLHQWKSQIDQLAIAMQSSH